MSEAIIPVTGGKLILCFDVRHDLLGAKSAEPPSLERVSFRYEGFLPKEMGLELVRRTPDMDGFTINGMTVLEFLESLGAD